MSNDEDIARLERLFAAILGEARARPAFARQLAAALGEGAAATAAEAAPATAGPGTARGRRPPFDADAFSVVAILQQEGEAALLARLNAYDSTVELRAIAQAQHLSLAGVPRRATAMQLRQAIVAAAAARTAGRLSAAS